MNAQEALETIKYEVNEEGHCGYIEDELRLAMTALEKQISKKPISNSHDMFGIKCCICPVCHCHVYSTSNDFCHRCGQALDWSDEK